MKNNKKVFKILAITTGVIILVVIFIFITLYLITINKFVEERYGNLRLKPRLEKIAEETGFFINTSVLKNAPSCSAQTVKNLVYQVMLENYLIEGESEVEWVAVDGEDSAINIIGKLYYPSIDLSGITLEDINNDIKRNTCSGNLMYVKQLREDAPPEHRRVVDTTYQCRIAYTTQVALDSGNIQVELLQKECSQGEPELEENDD